MVTYDFQKQVALITGGSKGIGKATALLLAQSGADVGIIARTAEEVETTAREIASITGQTCLALPGDVSDYGAMEWQFKTLMDTLGRLDILVNCAGTHIPKGVLATTLEEWQRVIDVNLTGVFICCKLGAEIMAKQMRGCIINISSVQAIRGGRSLQYTASKAGVEGLTRSLARDLAQYKVRVNTVAPGGTETDFAKRYWSPAVREGVNRDTLIGRPAEPEEIANAIAFLASDGASYITGETMHVNGGYYFH